MLRRLLSVIRGVPTREPEPDAPLGLDAVVARCEAVGLTALLYAIPRNGKHVADMQTRRRAASATVVSGSGANDAPDALKTPDTDAPPPSMVYTLVVGRGRGKTWQPILGELLGLDDQAAWVAPLERLVQRLLDDYGIRV